MKVNTRIPVVFEKVEDYDSRFQKVKIWLMHLGKNYNGSIFSKESVLGALESLKNTPILGYIEESKLGDKDFRGHEVELVIENGDLKTKYIGHAYGVIGESCNPRFEFKEGDNGDILEYLVVDGLLWTKFDDAISIIAESGEVAQSMELDEDYDGYWDEEGYFNFQKFSFYGACMLGKDVLPAMQKASVEMVFSASHIQDVIANKIAEFNASFNKNFKEVERLTLEELLAKYSITVEQLTEKEINVEEFSIEELEAKIQEVFKAESDNDDEQDKDFEANKVQKEEDETEFEKEKEEDKDKEDKDPNFEKDDKKFTVSFELSHDDIRRQMWDKIDSHMAENGLSEDWYYIVTVYDSNVIVENDWGNKFYKIDYTKENDVISFGSVIEVYPMFLTSDEKGALELMRSNFEKLEEENKNLKAFQKGVEKAQHEAEAEELFAQFSKLSDEDLAEIRKDIHNFSISEIESKLYEILGRKTVSFSKKETKVVPKIKVKIDEDAQPTSVYSHILAKYPTTE